MATTMKIDFINSNHLKYISKLSKRNDFYQKQLNTKMYGIYETDHGYAVIKNEMDLFINEEYRKGYFLVKNNKVIGFIIYQNPHNVYAKLDFLLIDKEYQKQGFGTILYQILKNECILDKLQFLVVECDEKSKEYYQNKLNFIGIDVEMKDRAKTFTKTKTFDDYDDKLALCLLHKCKNKTEFILLYKIF